jgi:hypothetical protein
MTDIGHHAQQAALEDSHDVAAEGFCPGRVERGVGGSHRDPPSSSDDLRIVRRSLFHVRGTTGLNYFDLKKGSDHEPLREFQGT